MTPKVGPSTPGRNQFSVDIKFLLRGALARAKKRGLQQKAIAIEMEICSGALSHWASDNYEPVIPLDMALLFAMVTGDHSLAKYMASQLGHSLSKPKSITKLNTKGKAAKERPLTA